MCRNQGYALAAIGDADSSSRTTIEAMMQAAGVNQIWTANTGSGIFKHTGDCNFTGRRFVNGAWTLKVDMRTPCSTPMGYMCDTQTKVTGMSPTAAFALFVTGCVVGPLILCCMCCCYFCFRGDGMEDENTSTRQRTRSAIKNSFKKRVNSFKSPFTMRMHGVSSTEASGVRQKDTPRGLELQELLRQAVTEGLADDDSVRRMWENIESGITSLDGMITTWSKRLSKIEESRAASAL